MGRWRWLNHAVLAVAAWYAAMFLLGDREGSFAGRDASDWRELVPLDPRGGARLFEHRDDKRLLLSLERPLWRELRRACLAVGSEPPCFAGSRHSFELAAEAPITAPRDGLTVEIETWSGDERRLAFRSVPDDGPVSSIRPR
jgi:hypothetical protein